MAIMIAIEATEGGLTVLAIEAHAIVETQSESMIVIVEIDNGTRTEIVGSNDGKRSETIGIGSAKPMRDVGFADGHVRARDRTPALHGRITHALAPRQPQQFSSSPPKACRPYTRATAGILVADPTLLHESYCSHQCQAGWWVCL